VSDDGVSDDGHVEDELDGAEKGTGGLTFEPPRAPAEDAPAIGFAPDLDDDRGAAATIDWSAQSAAPASAAPRARTPARPRREGVRYPLAEAALARLLGEEEAPAPQPTSRDVDDGPFSLGPAIMRPPPEIAQPAPEPDPAGDEEVSARARTDELMEDMVEMLLVGDDEDGQQQIHLSFKEDVFGGLYLKLERTGDGLFARFIVNDNHARRGVEGHVETLLARLRDRGMRIAGHEVEMRDD
jgi:flagellar hook-length control protein FliK